MSGGKPSGISFTLSKTKKGFVKPVNLETNNDAGKDEGIALKKTIVIPLKEGNEIGQRKPEAVKEPEVAYNPKGYGLQIRTKPSNTTIMPPTPYSTKSHDEPPAVRTVKRSDEEKLEGDLRVLPDDPSSKAYREVPVEEFGLAMLRGMGWDESKAKRQAQDKPATPKQRPPMLGLGAKPGDPNLIKRPDYISARNNKKKSDKDNGEVIAAGSNVKIVKGEHSHMFGTVTKISKGLATLKLRSSAEHVVVEAEHIVSEALASTLMPVSLKESLLEHIKSVYPGIMVQVISKTFNGGALYLKTGRIMDVHLEDAIQLSSIQFKDGSVVHSVPHTVMKSVIPPSGSDVMVLAGQHSGHRAFLLRLESGSRGVVQLSDDESIILTLSSLEFSSV